MNKKKLNSLSQSTPYFISRHSPNRFRKAWKKSLLSAPKKYWILYLYTLSFWRIKITLYLVYLQLHKAIKKRPLLSHKLFRLVWIDNIKPHSYYFYNFKNPIHWSNRHLYLYSAGLSHCIDSWASTEVVEILGNKMKFYLFCQKHQFSTPKNYALIDLDKWTKLEADYPWQLKTDFVIKRRTGSKGVGFIRFEYHENTNGYYSSEQEQSFPISTNKISQLLRNYFKKNKHSYLIQEKLTNHQVFEFFSNNSLIVIRVLSMVNKENEIEIFCPVLQIPQGNEILSNYASVSMIISPIIIETGQLGELISHKNVLKNIQSKTQDDLKI